MSTTTCSTPFEPCGKCAGVALAAAWESNSEPVTASPEAPISWRSVRLVSMGASVRAGHKHQTGGARRRGDTRVTETLFQASSTYPAGVGSGNQRMPSVDRYTVSLSQTR
ncbi:hypothetical protein Raf01_06210 [Rugosimonospora africana]|uniref:Uncharacterized protein n=1 Tax=Rugosimonospora africana TaxID=556532 RepID=A0A8J3QK42_9ACTN|nr:hypothetical protein Raf01_06210 [Rugosimonospora africana]